MMFPCPDGAACGDISLIVSRVAWSSVITRIVAGCVVKNGVFFYLAFFLGKMRNGSRTMLTDLLRAYLAKKIDGTV
jgi:glycosylphosphatidylinositol transamidase (GPIT) subunit GPI8